MIISPLYLHVS